MSRETTTQTPTEIATELSTALNMPVSDHAVNDFGDHYGVKLTFNGTLENEQLSALNNFGRVKIKRSGAGLSIALEIIK
jgi:hypothetical protein